MFAFEGSCIFEHIFIYARRFEIFFNIMRFACLRHFIKIHHVQGLWSCFSWKRVEKYGNFISASTYAFCESWICVLLIKSMLEGMCITWAGRVWRWYFSIWYRMTFSLGRQAYWYVVLCCWFFAPCLRRLPLGWTLFINIIDLFLVSRTLMSSWSRDK